MRWGTANRKADDAPLLVVHIETAQDLHDLKEKHPDFHEGALSILTYPTKPPVGFLNHDGPPRAFGGIRFMPGAHITKDNAGNFGILQDEKDFHES